MQLGRPGVEVACQRSLSHSSPSQATHEADVGDLHQCPATCRRLGTRLPLSYHPLKTPAGCLGIRLQSTSGAHRHARRASPNTALRLCLCFLSSHGSLQTGLLGFLGKVSPVISAVSHLARLKGGTGSPCSALQLDPRRLHSLKAVLKVFLALGLSGSLRFALLPLGLRGTGLFSVARPLTSFQCCCE